ncbi:MAG: hypothetical protein LBT09_03000 [Planctomycetaceae bacterium]|jgi:hypothetical protein|nr:hypothetical protein [Planctomycetaceae bacterium]
MPKYTPINKERFIVTIRLFYTSGCGQDASDPAKNQFVTVQGKLYIIGAVLKVEHYNLTVHSVYV